MHLITNQNYKKMAINASNNGTKRELIPAGNYVARCYQMIHIGTIMESYMGEAKLLNKVRIGWELPTEKRVFKEENGEQPFVISKEYTLSLNEKSNLRKILASWRGKDFTEKEAKSFDITALVGKPCLLNVIHKHGVADPSKIYEDIASITPVPKGMTVPPQINPSFVLDYDNFLMEKFELLPDFIKDKMRGSHEFTALKHPTVKSVENSEDAEELESISEPIDDLPF